ncbi:MAG: GMP synthase (glutamine-hydrolyzing), partial [Chitinophagales bacterium]
MEKILVIDFGSQYTQLIARRIRELNIFCEVFPFQSVPHPDEEVKGIILSGSPYSVHDADHP